MGAIDPFIERSLSIDQRSVKRARSFINVIRISWSLERLRLPLWSRD